MPLPNKNLEALLSLSQRENRKRRETVIAVNMLIKTPMPNTKAKPLMTGVEAK